MTHCYDDGIQIKVEPISPPEVPGAHEVAMDICECPVSSPSLETTPGIHGSPALWQQASSNAACPMGSDVKVEGEEIKTCSGTRKALFNKIQSGRRARGQEELVVKFEPETKNELTEMEIKKKERRKEQNRRAAQKCRIKKRELQSIAFQQYTSLLQQNGDLKNETTELKLEVRRLKYLLQEHESSGQCKLVNISQSQSTHPQTFCNKQATTTAPFNITISQPIDSNAETSTKPEELKRQASIEKIVKDLEMVTSQVLQSPSVRTDEGGAEKTWPCLPDFIDSNVMPFDDNMIIDIAEYLQNHSNTDDEENGSPSINVTDFESKAPAVDIPLKEGDGQFWGTDPDATVVAQNRKQCAVRNLNEEFARCANVDSLSTPIPETITLSTTIIPFCGHHQQQQQTTVYANNSNNSLIPTPLNLEQLPNHDFQNTIPVFDSSFLISNELSPISSYSSCTSPPSDLTSPSLFHSPAEIHRCSPDTAGYPQVPSVFRFPPDTRFSPAS